MFITIQGINVNTDLLKDFEVVGKTIIITDINNERSIYYFKSNKSAKEEELRILKELNNAKSK